MPCPRPRSQAHPQPPPGHQGLAAARWARARWPAGAAAGCCFAAWASPCRRAPSSGCAAATAAAKTSLLRILAGLSAPAEGELTWNDQPLARQANAPRPLYIGHANALKDDLTLTEAVAFLARLQGLDNAAERATRAIDRLGLASRRQALVRTLSQGQRRRGALARLALDEAPATWLAGRTV